MNLHENSELGRKVFFINPLYTVEKLIIPELRDKEYEVYTIKDFHYAKSILRDYPDSICFINIDDDMPVKNWYNFVRSFEKDESLSSIFVGIITNRATHKEKELFLYNTILPAGFLSAKIEHTELLDTIVGILDINGAKGRRKYVRADCQEDKKLQAHCILSGFDIPMKIQNISSVGFSCLIPAPAEKLFSVNTVVRKVSFNLHNVSIVCGAAVIAKKEVNNKILIVMLFLKGTLHAAKSAIRKYINDYLESLVKKEILTKKPDNRDYSKKEKEPMNVLEKTFLPETEVEEIEEAELLEEPVKKTSSIEPTLFTTEDLTISNFF